MTEPSSKPVSHFEIRLDHHPDHVPAENFQITWEVSSEEEFLEKYKSKLAELAEYFDEHGMLQAVSFWNVSDDDYGPDVYVRLRFERGDLILCNGCWDKGWFSPLRPVEGLLPLTNRYSVRIDHDPDVESPCNADGAWKVYSFHSRHINLKKPEHFYNEQTRKPKFWLQRKLDIGLAFILDYYEHSGGTWSLRGEGMNDAWDTSRGIGLMVWEEPAKNMGAKTLEDRAKDARSFLDEYNDWCEGACYMFTIENEETGEELGKGDGLIGTDAVLSALREELPEDATPENTSFEGDSAWMVKNEKIFAEQAK